MWRIWHVSVPTLWDRTTGTVVSNTYTNIGIDLATQFGSFATPLIATYPADLAAEIDALDGGLLPAVNQGIHAAAQPGEARDRVLDAFTTLDSRLADQRVLLGDRLTEADVRLYVSLVRFDVGPNATHDIVAGLHVFPNLWGYARDLYSIDAFGSSTDFGTFTAPGAAVPDWREPTDRTPVHAGV